MAEKIQIIIGGKIKSVERKAADFLVKIHKAKYVEQKDQIYKTRMMVADKPKVSDGKEELKRILDKAGIEYDGRLGETKLRDLVESIKV